MKKIFSFIVAIGLASIPVVAESPSVDLSAMTLDELVELRDRVNFEIDSSIGRGKYIAGEMIAAGIYEFIPTEVEFRGYSYCSLYVRDGTSDEIITSISSIPVGSGVIFKLREGDILEISEGSGILKNADKTWMPQE